MWLSMADACVKALEGKYDFAAIHVEAPDECTHNGDTKGKLQAIEWLDTRVLTPLTQRLAAAFPRACTVHGDRLASVARGLGEYAARVFGDDG